MIKTVKRLLAAATIMSLASLTIPVSAAATEAPTLSVRSDATTTWADAYVATSGEVVQVRFLAPRETGGMQVWQTCRFAEAGSGIYRCGIDTSSQSLASKAEGRWVAKLLIGGEVAARTSFRL